MEISRLDIVGSWRSVADAARTTVNMSDGDGEPSSSWKRRMLLSEHSPIRQLMVRVKWIDLPSWVSVHFVRHKIGVEHWVRSQRTDRTGIDRSKLPQDSLVEHEMLLSSQAIINISRRRLCNMAATDTMRAWQLFLNELEKVDPELYSVCVPDCIYRGWCGEYKSCGYNESKDFIERLNIYHNQVEDNI